MRVSNKKFKISFILISLIVLLITALVSLKLGSVNITFKELITGLFSGSSEGNIGIIKDLRRVVFPGYFGDENISSTMPGYFLGNMLTHIYEELKVQSKDHLIHQPPVKK